MKASKPKSWWKASPAAARMLAFTVLEGFASSDERERWCDLPQNVRRQLACRVDKAIERARKAREGGAA